MTTSNQVQLIPIDDTSVNGKVVKTADARKLHAKLGVRQDFSHWVKAQIKRARLTEGKDYVKLAEKDELSATGQTSTEYHITVAASKHISMMSNTDKGHEVREYFIQVEEDHVNQRISQAQAQAQIDHTNNKYTEIGEALVRAVRYQEYDSAKELDAMLDKLDFEPAARTEGVPVSVIRNRIALHTAATVRLDHIARGEHGHGDSVRDVVSLAQAKAQTEDMELKIENRRLLEIARAKKPPTLDEIVAYDMAHKHDNTVRKLRAVKK